MGLYGEKLRELQLVRRPQLGCARIRKFGIRGHGSELFRLNFHRFRPHSTHLRVPSIRVIHRPLHLRTDYRQYHNPYHLLR